MNDRPFSVDIAPNWEGLLSCIERRGTPDRVYFVELLWDEEVQTAICERFGLLDGLDPDDAFFDQKRLVKLQRFLGYDFVRCSLDDWKMPLNRLAIEDTAELGREGGRSYIDEHKGPITNWEEFEAYPWPDPESASTRSLEWYEANLPEDMCVVGSGGFAHFAEYLTWLMGYETLCYALFDQRELVAAISQRLIDVYRRFIKRLLEFDRVKLIWGSDDMGFLDTIMEDLIEDVGIDAKHSFEDTIESVISAKAQYGDRIAVLGGVDMDFLCWASEGQVRQRVRDTLEECMPGGGYCLGTGNSVANYIPLDNYLAMLDEGRKFQV
jgi:uroporphyrinogen decarboxylase